MSKRLMLRIYPMLDSIRRYLVYFFNPVKRDNSTATSVVSILYAQKRRNRLMDVFMVSKFSANLFKVQSPVFVGFNGAKVYSSKLKKLSANYDRT